MERLRQLLAGLGVAYTLTYAVLYVICGRPALFAGIGLIAGYYALTTSQATNGLPWMVLWALLHFGCRILTGLLRSPGGGGRGCLVSGPCRWRCRRRLSRQCARPRPVRST